MGKFEIEKLGQRQLQNQMSAAESKIKFFEEKQARLAGEGLELSKEAKDKLEGSKEYLKALHEESERRVIAEKARKEAKLNEAEHGKEKEEEVSKEEVVPQEEPSEE